MTVLVTNNATSRLASSIASGATTLTVTTGEGAKYPSPASGAEWFPVTLIKDTGTLEIVRCTSRSGDVLTIQRAQEGTTAQAFAAGDRVELRMTAAAIAELQLPATNKGFIAGLQLVYTGRTSLTVTAGRAYISSAGKQLVMAADKVMTGLTLSASTFMHAYYFESGGVGDIELSTTVPERYWGTAYQKTGDASRRYIGSMLTNASGQFYAYRHDLSAGEITYLEGTPPIAPFVQVNGFGGTSPSGVSSQATCPIQTATFEHVGVQSTGLNYIFSYEQLAAGSASAFMTVVGSTVSTHNVLSDIYIQLCRVIGANLGQYLVAVQAIAGAQMTVFSYGYKFER
jgi:hypothetical protein